MLLHLDMGFPEKDRPEPMRWPVSGISPPRTPLRSIHTRPSESGGGGGGEEEEEEEEWSTAVTPTAKEAKIPEQLRCPPAPRKRKPPARCQRSSRVGFFSCPPDLEAVFVRRPPEEAK